MKLTLTIDLAEDGDTKAVQVALVELALSLAREDTDHQEGDTGHVVVAGTVAGSWAVA